MNSIKTRITPFIIFPSNTASSFSVLHRLSPNLERNYFQIQTRPSLLNPSHNRFTSFLSSSKSSLTILSTRGENWKSETPRKTNMLIAIMFGALGVGLSYLMNSMDVEEPKLESEPGLPAERINSPLYEKVKKLEKIKPSGWQETAMKLIRQSYLDDPKLELHRLRIMQVLDVETEKKIEKAIGYDPIDKVALGRILEIKKIYQSTHWVFNHYQNNNFRNCTILQKELMRINHSDLDMHHYKYLRLKSNPDKMGIKRYSENSSTNDWDFNTSQNLISADGYLVNNREGESAVYFYKVKRNIGIETAIDIDERVILTFYPKIEKLTAMKYALKIEYIARDADSGGNFVVICVPKKTSHTIQYQSHSQGVPCQCHPKEDADTILSKLQQNKELDSTVLCEYGRIPQFRLYTPELTKENGVRIYRVTPNKESLRIAKQLIRNLVAEIHQEYLAKTE